MSHVTFHSIDGNAELSGRERAYAGCLTHDLALSMFRGGRERYERVLPAGHYLRDTDDERWMDSFRTWWRVGMDSTFDFGGYRPSPWQMMAATLDEEELTDGLGHLLAAKDCFVRAALDKQVRDDG